MTKYLALSVSPTEALNVLNGKQTALLRKRVPKGYVGWCYGVVSKKLSGRMVFKKGEDWYGAILSKNIIAKYPNHFENEYGGRIPFRFWYEGVEEVSKEKYWNNTNQQKYLMDAKGYAISITKLEVFDKPMELGEFHREIGTYSKGKPVWKEITKSPSTYQYVWVKE